MDCCKSSAQREIHSDASLSQKRRSQIDNLTLHLNELEKEEQKRPKVSRRKEIIKIKEEINKIEIQKTIEEINKTKSCFFEKIKKIAKLWLDSSRREKTQITSEMKKKSQQVILIYKKL